MSKIGWQKQIECVNINFLTKKWKRCFLEFCESERGRFGNRTFYKKFALVVGKCLTFQVSDDKIS